MLDWLLYLRGSFFSELASFSTFLVEAISSSFEFSSFGYAAAFGCFFLASPGPTTTYVFYTLLISIRVLGASLDADLFLLPFPFLV